MGSAPLLSRPTRVVLGCPPGAEEGEELLILGAIKELKSQHDRVDLEYVTSSQAIYTLLKNSWFLHQVHLLSVDADWQLAFDDVVGNDFGLCIFEPDPQAAAIAEEYNYKAGFDQEVAQKTKIWEAYQAKGMKDIVKDLPVYNFNAQWHKSNGYLWSIADKLGIQVDVPFRTITPYGEITAKSARSAQCLASKAHLTDTPFGVFDFHEETLDMVLAGVLGKVMHPVKMVSLQSLQKEIGTDLIQLLGVLSHKNCEFVAGPVGSFLFAAWAAGVPSIFNLYRGSNWRWDGVNAYNCFPLAVDQYDDERLPSAVYQGLVLLKERLNYSQR